MSATPDSAPRILRCTLLIVILGAGIGGVPIDAAQGASTGEQVAVVRSPAADTIRAPKRVDVAVLSSVGSTLLPAAGGTILVDRARDVPAYRRDDTALWCGVGSIAAGLLVGPSLGHFYAQNHDQAWTGMTIRGAAAASGMLALWAYPFQEVGPTADRASSSENESTAKGILNWVMVASTAVLVSRSFYDLLSTPQVVQAYNARPDVRASVVPHVVATEDGAGLTVRVQF